jgi:arylsulfatase A-like enzyme/Tfp pilus assembly protein PilF
MTLTAVVTAFGQTAATKPAQRKMQPQTGTTAATRSGVTRPSVILITIDTLRADHVGCYGAQMVKTPTLDALAHDGVVFERAISQVPLTWPSHAVILTGTYPFQNGVQDFTGQPLAQQFRTVAQSFQHAGYATGAVVSAFVLDRSWGLARGFDFYDDAFSAETFEKKDVGLVDRRAGESVAHAISWLKNSPRRPFFLWLHLYDPHSPYDSPEPYRSEYRSHPYDGAIAYADHELGNLMAWLKQNHLYDTSLIVALSDHGESLGEHGEDEHGFFLYNATVRVPLIVKPPVKSPAGSGIAAGRRRDPVETAAVAPTLLQLAGLKDSTDPIQSQFQSHALFETKSDANQAGSHGANDPAYSETFYPFSSFGWSPLHALESDRFHFIEAPQPELYDLESDPGETRNIAGEQPATVAVFRQKLQALLAHNPFTREEARAGNLSPDAQEKLRALGYFGFRAAVSAESLKQGLADPKDKLWEFNSILKATDDFQRHEDDQAEALLTEVQQKDPQIYVIPFLLGESALRRQNWDRAAGQLQRSLVLNPNFDNAMTGLAQALAKLGRVDEAKDWLKKALQINPESYGAWYQLGVLDAKTKSDPAAALASYQKAIAIQPNFAPGQRETGMGLYQQKDYAGAATHLEKALSLGLEDARLHNFLGICYSQTGQISKAVHEHERAIALDPNLAEAHLNLALDYQHIGKIGQARAEYASACKLEAKFCGATAR